MHDSQLHCAHTCMHGLQFTDLHGVHRGDAMDAFSNCEEHGRLDRTCIDCWRDRQSRGNCHVHPGCPARNCYDCYCLYVQEPAANLLLNTCSQDMIDSGSVPQSEYVLSPLVSTDTVPDWSSWRECTVKRGQMWLVVDTEMPESLPNSEMVDTTSYPCLIVGVHMTAAGDCTVSFFKNLDHSQLETRCSLMRLVQHISDDADGSAEYVYACKPCGLRFECTGICSMCDVSLELVQSSADASERDKLTDCDSAAEQPELAEECRDLCRVQKLARRDARRDARLEKVSILACSNSPRPLDPESETVPADNAAGEQTVSAGGPEQSPPPGQGTPPSWRGPFAEGLLPNNEPQPIFQDQLPSSAKRSCSQTTLDDSQFIVDGVGLCLAADVLGPDATEDSLMEFCQDALQHESPDHRELLRF